MMLWDDVAAPLPTEPVHHTAEVDRPPPLPPPPDIEPIPAKPAPSGFWAALIRILSSIIKR